MDLKKFIRNVPDFPEKGIMFRDITPILQDPTVMRKTIELIAKKISDVEFDLIIGPESRGFIFGVPLACALNKGFIPVRKAGKLPFEVIRKDYDLEYGSSTIEMHADAIKNAQEVIIVDDLLATGGTCKAMCEMIEEQGGIVKAIVFLIELEGLGGREKIGDYDIRSIVRY